MKKNITINIFGTLYHIDEDAYELLQKYNENMRRYYGGREGGEEIADDVEHRVAELMSELQSQGILAITIDHVKEIINRIGDPQEMDERDSGDSTANATGETTTEGGGTTTQTAGVAGDTGRRQEGDTPNSNESRKLFRDTEDKILGGVISGLSHYLGIKDPLLPRVIMILLALISLTTFGVIYIIAWVLIPEAITAEDRLRMYGKPVNAKAINEELMRGLNNANQFVTNPQRRDQARGCLSSVLKFFLVCIGGFFAFILGCILFALLAAIMGVSVAAIFVGLEFFNIPFDLNMVAIPKGLLITAATSAILVIGLPLFGLMRWILKSKDSENMSLTMKVLLILLWMLSVGVMVGSLVKGFNIVAVECENFDKQENTRNGIYLPGFVWRALDHEGWKIDLLDKTNIHIYQNERLPNGNWEYLKISAEDNPNEMSYNLSKERHLRPGSYKVSAYVNSDDEGNALYVVYNQGADTLRIDIPAHQPSETSNEISDEEVVVDSDDYDDDQGWVQVEGNFDIKGEETVKFGISNVNGFHNSPCNSSTIKISNVKISSKTE